MLDPDQHEAACSDLCRPLLVLAHAGAGKTRTLVERLVLLQEARRSGGFGARGGGAVAALTFTRTAMRELRDRLTARTGDDALDGYEVRTFHSLGYALYCHGWARDYDNRPRVRVATRAQAQHAAASAAHTVGLDLAPGHAVRLIADAKLGLPVRRANPALVEAALAVHDDLLAQRDLLHVHDLLVRPVRLLGAVPALRQELRARYWCVVGDEAQNWSPYQAALVAYLAGPEGHVTACGDPRQAIFGGSSPRFLLEFPAVYPGACVITLRTTYRLSGPLLALSRAIAAHLPGGAIAGLAHQPDGPLPLVHIARARGRSRLDRRLPAGPAPGRAARPLERGGRAGADAPAVRPAGRRAPPRRPARACADRGGDRDRDAHSPPGRRRDPGLARAVAGPGRRHGPAARARLSAAREAAEAATIAPSRARRERSLDDGAPAP